MLQDRCRIPLMRTALSASVLALFALGYLGANEVAQNKQPPGEATSDSRDREDQQEVEQLLQIRKKMGSAWKGDAFALMDGSDTKSLPSEEEVVRTALAAQSRAAHFTPVPFAPISRPDWRATLRNAAHELDLTAYALECQDLYDQADELRAVAHRFRLQARSEENPSLLRQERSWMPAPAKATD